MLTALNDDLKLIKINGELCLIIKLNGSLSSYQIPINNIVYTDISLVLTRTTLVEYPGLFTIYNKELPFAFVGKETYVSLSGIGVINMNSSKQEAENYLIALVANINKVALEIHDIVTRAETNDSWDDLN